MNLSSRFNPALGLVGTVTVVLFQTQSVIALTASEVNNIAKQITVRIDGANTGSGVIIDKQGNTYTVLTNRHVVEFPGKYTIQTPDGKRYSLNSTQVQSISGVDLAVLQFTSSEQYRKAEIGNSDQLNEGIIVYVAGWADPDAISTQRNYRFQDGRISARLSNGKKGYNLVYNNVTKAGMSGGPLLDEQGRLVGINGQGLRDVRTEATDFFGIPINIYLKFASIRPSTPKPSTPVATVSQPPINRQYYPQRRRINSVTNISDYLIASSNSNSFPNNSFTYLNKALEASGLKDTLRMQGSFTLFAPTDAAIAKIKTNNVMQDLLKPENKEVLVKIFKYHIVYGKLLTRDLRTGKLKSFEGQPINAKVNSASDIMVNDAKLIQTDIETSNGVIHVIDNLILPPDL